MMDPVDDLVVWLRAQLDEDQQLAQAWLDDTTSVWWWDNADPASAAERVIVRNSPRQLLAEVEAKRKILDRYEQLHGLLGTWSGSQHDFYNLAGQVGALWTSIRLLALPYSDSPGYREEWRPTQ